jgi:hypothetical protein
VVELGVLPASPRGEPQHLPPCVALGPLADDQPLLVQPGEQAAQLAGVHVERRAQRGDLGHLRAPQLVQHARLGQRVARAVQPAAQDPDLVGVEPGELAGGGDGAGRRRGGGGHAESLPRLVA